MKNTSIAIIVWFALGVAIASGLMWATQRGDSQLRLNEYPTRIICAAPSAVETVFALGEGERVIAVSDFTVYPPEATELQTVGGYINPNFERILALRPDLIITQGVSAKLTEFCREWGIALLRIDMDDIDAILLDIQRIGDALGAEEKASELAVRLREELDEISGNAPTETKPSVFLSLSRTAGTLSNIMTAGKGTYFSDLLEIAGGVNIFSDVETLYPQISTEALARRAPDIILEFRISEQNALRPAQNVFDDWQRLPTIPAVRNGRIHWVTEEFFMIPGPRVAQAARRLYEIIHHEGPSGGGP